MEENFFNRPIAEIISDLQQRNENVRLWSELRKAYYPEQHEIVVDKQTRQDKVREDGVIDKAARIHLGLEQLLVKRMTDFLFAIPVKRNYKYDANNERQKAIVEAIEAIYKDVRFHSLNLNRSKKVYASQEAYTHWYLVKKEHQKYGFKSDYKLKCNVYSPMDDVDIYPYFDEDDDLKAVSLYYSKTIGESTTNYFDVYTEDKHYLYVQQDAEWKVEIDGEEIEAHKIPGVYTWVKDSLYYDLQDKRSEIEYTLSRNSDVIAYNSAPVLKVVGQIIGKEKKGETQRILRVEQGGDVSYVSWQQGQDAVKAHVETMLSLYFMLSQLPDISASKMMSLGNVGYDARMTIFMDAHLKVGEESEIWLETFDREYNIIKSFLPKLNQEFTQEDIDAVECEFEITPYMPKDAQTSLDMILKANGQKAVMSQKESIERAGYSKNAEDTLKQIREEEEIAKTESVFL